MRTSGVGVGEGVSVGGELTAMLVEVRVADLVETAGLGGADPEGRLQAARIKASRPAISCFISMIILIIEKIERVNACQYVEGMLN
jgi:hypothetical protein